MSETEIPHEPAYKEELLYLAKKVQARGSDSWSAYIAQRGGGYIDFYRDDEPETFDYWRLLDPNLLIPLLEGIQ